MGRTSALLIALGAVGASAFVGGRTGPTPDHPRTALWYFTLRKPAVTPPGPAIGAAWMALDALLVYAGYRLMTAPRSPERKVSLVGWTVSVAGVAVHSLAFFGRRSTLGGLAVAASMAASSVATTVAAFKVDRLAAFASLPLVGWTFFAAGLNEELWRRN